MTAQPIPKVNRLDVERIVRRDFSSEAFEKILAILDEYGKESHHTERNRVQIAVLKLANGNNEKLRFELENAKRDYRDTLSWAEYPNYINIPSKEISKTEVQEVITNDWQQYQKWLWGSK